MAQVVLQTQGQALAQLLSPSKQEENRRGYAMRSERLRAALARAAAGWSLKATARVHAKGKWTARERLQALADRDSPMVPIGTLVNWGRTFQTQGGAALEAIGAGVLTAAIKIHGRWCVAIANDNTVASGAWWPRSPEKIQRAQRWALRLRLPVVYLVDCSGLFLPEQAQTFAGATGAGHIFALNAELSAQGVPQLAGVMGDCIAGGGYMPIISDRVIMTQQAYMVIAGAALLKGAKGQQVTSLDIGGPQVHVEQSGCADAQAPDDAALIADLRAAVDGLPSSAASYYRAGRQPVPPCYPCSDLEALIPPDHRRPYVAEEVLARLCDASAYWEVLPARGQEVLCAVGRVGGLYAAFVLNRQGTLRERTHTGRGKIGGILYREGIAKLSVFRRACDDDGLPMVWLQDVSGFDIGAEAEAAGLLGYGSSLIYGNSTAQAPSFSVLLRKASGAGYYALQGLPYGPVLQLSTPLARQSVMDGKTAAIASYRSRLDENFRIATCDPKEREQLEADMAAVEARVEGDMDPLAAASRMDTDEVIELGDLRAHLAHLIEMAYQAPGARRSKNPRIWSLHDLDHVGSSEFSVSSPKSAKST